MAEKRSDKIPSARDLMEEVRTTLRPETDLLTAIEVLAEHGQSAAPVVDSERRLLGMLTEKDCLHILSLSAFYRPRSGKVGDFLSPVRDAIEVEMDLFRISELFLATNFPMLPVVDRGKLVGCITRQGMLRGIMSLTRALQTMEQRIEADARDAVERPRSIGEMQKMFASYSRQQLVRRLGRKS